MSADLWAEFGQGSGPAQSSRLPTRTAQPTTNSLVDGSNQSDDIFFGNASKASQKQQQDSRVTSQQSQHVPTSPAPHQPGAYATFDLPRPHDSDVLFDATEDTPVGEAEDDEWGDFEGPEATAGQQIQSQSSTVIIPHVQAVRVPTAQASQNPGVSGTIDLLSGLSIAESSPVDDQQSLNSTGHPTQPRWDDSSFGNWGEFTKAQSTKLFPPKSPQQPVQMNTQGNSLLEDDSFGDWLDFADGPSPNPLSPKTTKEQTHAKAIDPIKAGTPTKATRSTRSRATIQTKSTIQSKPQPPAWEDDAFDDWCDFDAGPAPSKPISTSTSSSTTRPTPSPQSFTTNTPTSPPTVRPTNIPPPSILLEHLLTHLHTLATEAQTAQTLPPPQRAPTASKIHNTLHTAARIIAGRTHRWKRDTLLAQSMRIGPAHSGKSGGMKLSAVNKHEDVKESQDAVDVLALWRERAALFNAVVQAAGQKPIPVVPDPAALRVVSMRAEQGGIKAGHACALCALRREERVVRVDGEDVRDSFGEWWTEHWGHTGCKVFWEENRGLLMQR